MSISNQHKVIIVGSGEVSTNHIRGYHKSGFAQIIAICDKNRILAEQASRKWRIPHYYTDLSEALKTEEMPDVVDICTPTSTHKAIALTALEHGCHVLVEKPFTTTLKDAEEILALAKRKGRKACVAHTHKMNGLVTMGKKMVEDGAIGEIRNMYLTCLEPKETPMIADPNHWVHKAPGGRWEETMPHYCYLPYTFVGPLHLESVLKKKLPGGYPWLSADEVVVNLSSDKHIVTLHFSANFSRTDHSIYLYGTEGMMRIALGDQTIELHKRRNPVMKRIFGVAALDSSDTLIRSLTRHASVFFKVRFNRRYSNHDLLIKAFLDSLDGGSDVVSDEEALYVVRMTEEISNRI